MRRNIVALVAFALTLITATPAQAYQSIKTTLTYEPTLEVEVKDTEGKVITDWDFDAHPFTATLETQSGAPMPDITKSVTNSYGVIKWPTVELEQGKTYIYTMRQIEGETEGVTYDVKPHALTITVNYEGYPTCLWDSTPVSSKYVSIANTFDDPTEPPADEPQQKPDTPPDTGTDTTPPDTGNGDNAGGTATKPQATPGTGTQETIDYVLPDQGIDGVLSDTGFTAPALALIAVSGLSIALLVRRTHGDES